MKPLFEDKDVEEEVKEKKDDEVVEEVKGYAPYIAKMVRELEPGEVRRDPRVKGRFWLKLQKED